MYSKQPPIIPIFPSCPLWSDDVKGGTILLTSFENDIFVCSYERSDRVLSMSFLLLFFISSNGINASY